MNIEDAKKVNRGDHLMYVTKDDFGNPVEIECVVKSIWGEPNKFACDMICQETDLGVTNVFAPIACFKTLT